MHVEDSSLHHFHSAVILMRRERGNFSENEYISKRIINANQCGGLLSYLVVQISSP